MKRQHVRAALAALAVGLFAPGAFAQLPTYIPPPTGPGYRPAISPYLNLRFGPGGYFNLTRPQQQAFRNIGQLQTNLQALQMQADAGTSLGGVPVASGITGHPVAFFNYGQYYTFPFPRYGPTTGSSPALGGLGAPPGSVGFGTGGFGTFNQLGQPPGGQQSRGRISPVIGIR